MPRREEAFAIVRLSTHLPGWERNPEWAFEVVKIVYKSDEAESEVKRLNACAEGTQTRFLVKLTKVISHEQKNQI